MRVDDRTDGVIQPKQLAVYLNRRAILRGRSEAVFA